MAPKLRYKGGRKINVMGKTPEPSPIISTGLARIYAGETVSIKLYVAKGWGFPVNEFSVLFDSELLMGQGEA